MSHHKIKFISTFILFTLIFFVFKPKQSFAVSCQALNGHCILTGTCAFGKAPLNSSDCQTVGFKCCPNLSSCQSLNGHCVISGSCAFGASPIQASGCSAGAKCCPNLSSCQSLDGHCVISGKCAYGAPIPASGCSAVAKCCPNQPGNPNQGSGYLNCQNKNGDDGINTALGCISTNIQSGGFVGDFLEIAIGMGGGIALLLILYGIFIITTSAGNPDKLNQGREIIASATSGLLFIILSIVLLNLIGVKILAIPGF